MKLKFWRRKRILPKKHDNLIPESVMAQRMFREDIAGKRRQIFQAYQQSTRRPHPGHLGSGFVQDRRARDIINTRMFSNWPK